MANGVIGFSFLDAGRKSSSVSLEIGAITALTLPDNLTAVGTLRGAIDAVTLGTISKERMAVFETKLSNATPASDFARRTLKWVVSYEDITQFFDAPVNAIPNEAFGNVYTVTIPTADPNGRMQEGTNLADLANADIAALVTALEANLRSPAGGEINVVQIALAGRNL